jgi:hypothetical protein
LDKRRLLLDLSDPGAIDNQGEGDKPDKDDITFVEPRQDAAKAFEAAEQALDLAASLVHSMIALPWIDSIALWWNHGNKIEFDARAE